MNIASFNLQEVIETLSAAIMNLSTITELAESTVVVLVEHIKTCVKMLQESLKGSFDFCTVNLYSVYCIIIFQQISLC